MFEVGSDLQTRRTHHWDRDKTREPNKLTERRRCTTRHLIHIDHFGNELAPKVDRMTRWDSFEETKHSYHRDTEMRHSPGREPVCHILLQMQHTDDHCTRQELHLGK